MRIFGRHHSAAHLAFRILDGNFPLCPFHQNDNVNQRQNHKQQHGNHAQRHGADASQFESLRQSARNIGDNTDGNNQRRTVAYAAGSNLLAQPDNKHRTADQ